MYVKNTKSGYIIVYLYVDDILTLKNNKNIIKST